MAKSTFKGIIRNMVDYEIDKFVDKHNGFNSYDEKEITLINATKDFENISFDAIFKAYTEKNSILPNEYKVHGYVSEYGVIYITSLRYEGIYIKDVEKDLFDKNNQIKKEWYIHGNELKSFTFADITKSEPTFESTVF